MTDPGGGDGGSKRGQPAWQLPVGRGLRPSWASSTHTFPSFGSHPTEVRGQDRSVAGPDQGGAGKQEHDCAGLGIGGGSSSVVPPASGAQKHGRGVRPAGGDRQSPQKVKDGQTDVRLKIILVSDGPVVGRILEWCLFWLKLSQNYTEHSGPRWRGIGW